MGESQTDDLPTKRLSSERPMVGTEKDTFAVYSPSYPPHPPSPPLPLPTMEPLSDKGFRPTISKPINSAKTAIAVISAERPDRLFFGIFSP
jgi:hypothetical protein